jgi:hypothetical protein
MTIISNYIEVASSEKFTYIAVDGTKVYNMWDSLKMAGYPMAKSLIEDSLIVSQEKLEKRAVRLGNAKAGSGHDCFLKGIMVSATISIPQYMWQQLKRYHFIDIISSMSTMHRILSMELGRNQFTKGTPVELITHLRELVAEYNARSEFEFPQEIKEQMFEEIVASIPSGFILPAGICTNYLQLKTIYNQRKHHKLRCWKEFCTWCESLPYFKEFCIKEKENV